MKSILLLFAILLAGATAWGQRSYQEAISQGDAALKRGQYKTAIAKYFAAEAFDPSKKEAVKAKVNRVFDEIERLKKEAEQSRKAALKKKKIAEDALAQVKREQERSQALLRMLRENNDLSSTNHFEAAAIDIAYFNEILNLLRDNIQFYLEESDSTYVTWVRSYYRNLYVRKALAYTNSGDWGSGLEILNYVLDSLDKNDAFALSTRTYALYLNQQPQACIRDANRLEDLGSVTLISMLNKAVSLAQLGRFKESEMELFKTREQLRQEITPGRKMYLQSEIDTAIVQAVGLRLIYIDSAGLDKILQGFGIATEGLDKSVVTTDFNDVTDRIRALGFSLNEIMYLLNWFYDLRAYRSETYRADLFIAYLWELAGFPEEAQAAYQHGFSRLAGDAVAQQFVEARLRTLKEQRE